MSVTRPSYIRFLQSWGLKWSTRREQSNSEKKTGLSPSYQKLVFWCHFVPPDATGATLGVWVQILPQVVRIGHIYHLQVISQNRFLEKKS